MRKFFCGFLLLAMFAGAGAPAQAQDKQAQDKQAQDKQVQDKLVQDKQAEDKQAEDKQDNLPVSIEKRLESFDPAAVAAARHYYGNPQLKASLVAMVPRITQAMSIAVERANPGLDADSKREALEAAQEAVTSKLDLITDMSMIAALEVLSKDELVALDQFYSSPVGQSVMTKLPQIMGRLPAMMQVAMPLMLDDLRAKMKAKGKDLHL